MRLLALALLALTGCSVTSLFGGSALLCDDDAACADGEACVDRVCRPDVGEGEGEGEGEGDVGEGEGEGDVGEGEGDVGEGEGEGEGDVGEGEGEGEGNFGCGDGEVLGDEECDDENGVDNDGCDADCRRSAVVDLALGDDFTCALLRDGLVRCWGRDDHGQLGNGPVPANLTAANNPVAVLGGRALRVVAGGNHACAILVGGDVRCWGSNQAGALGAGTVAIGDVGDDETPAALPPVSIGAPAVELAAGDTHTCAITNAGDVVCWGDGSHGQLGYGNRNNIGDNESPQMAGVVPLGGPVIGIDAGAAHTCVRTPTEIRCWGENEHRQLGSPDEDVDDASLAVVLPLNGTVVTGGSHTCVFAGSTAGCVGNGTNGRLGNGGVGDVDQLAPALHFGDAIVSMSAGDAHTCAVLEDGSLACWGAGAQGRLGRGNDFDLGDDEAVETASRVDVGGAVERVACGTRHTCALLVGGALRCWGQNANGALGTGDLSNVGDDEAPASVATQVF